MALARRRTGSRLRYAPSTPSAEGLCLVRSFKDKRLHPRSEAANDSSDAGGIEAICRWLSEATPPDRLKNIEHPVGMPVTQAAGPSLFRTEAHRVSHK